MGQICIIQADFDAVPQSCPLILCNEHFTECNFVNFMVKYQMRFASKWNL